MLDPVGDHSIERGSEESHCFTGGATETWAGCWVWLNVLKNGQSGAETCALVYSVQYVKYLSFGFNQSRTLMTMSKDPCVDCWFRICLGVLVFNQHVPSEIAIFFFASLLHLRSSQVLSLNIYDDLRRIWKTRGISWLGDGIHTLEVRRWAAISNWTSTMVEIGNRVAPGNQEGPWPMQAWRTAPTWVFGPFEQALQSRYRRECKYIYI